MSLKEVLEMSMEELFNTYDENNATKVLILKVMVFISPVLRQCGIYFTGPIALITDNYQQANRITKDLAGFAPHELTGTTVKEKELKMVLQSAEYELIPFWFSRGKGSSSNIQYMEEFCRIDNSHEDAIGGHVVLIAFSGGIPPEIMDYVIGKVYLTTKDKSHGKKNKCNEVFLKVLIDYVLENFPAIRREIETLAEKWNQEEAGILALLAAEKVCRMMIEDAGFLSAIEDKYIKNCIKAAGILAKEWTMSDMEVDWKEQFLRVFYESTEWIPDILNRERVRARDIKRLEELPVSDSEYYYLSISLFHSICESMLVTVSIDYIKRILAEEEFIIGEGKLRNYQTVKVSVITEYGAVIRIRKIRLNRLKIDRQGKLSWYEIIKLKKGCVENDEDCGIGEGTGKLALFEGC